MKNAEATKSAVDLELKDLAATLKNIEEARPFEDLSVVCLALIKYMTRILIGIRTMLPAPRRLSTRRPPSSCPRDAGWYPATRYVFRIQLIK